LGGVKTNKRREPQFRRIFLIFPTSRTPTASRPNGIGQDKRMDYSKIARGSSRSGFLL